MGIRLYALQADIAVRLPQQNMAIGAATPPRQSHSRGLDDLLEGLDISSTDLDALVSSGISTGEEQELCVGLLKCVFFTKK